jgi:predicted HD phosphohydrolase
VEQAALICFREMQDRSLTVSALLHHFGHGRTILLHRLRRHDRQFG